MRFAKVPKRKGKSIRLGARGRDLRLAAANLEHTLKRVFRPNDLGVKPSHDLPRTPANVDRQVCLANAFATRPVL